jgi:Trk K+ transport system NAD-binding subunit
LAFVLTALATSPLYDSAYGLYGQMKPVLTKLGFGESAASRDSTHAEYDVALLGLHRDASSLLHNIIRKQPDIAPRTLVIDFNVSLHPKIRELGVEVKYGDISNSETLLHAGIERAKIIICTITDDLLRGTNNRDLVASLRAHCPDAVIVANAIELSMVKEVYAAGADYVYMPRLSVAQTLTELVEAALRGGIEDYKDQERQRIGAIEGRSEVLS